jgi:hypothetical protein
MQAVILLINNSVNSILQSYSNLQEAEAEELDIDKK